MHIGRPDDEHARTICKPGSAATCRYLAMDAAGWACVKHHAAATVINARVAAGTMNARGDNCPGLTEQDQEEAS